jgi:Cytochrome c554 and c-prime
MSGMKFSPSVASCKIVALLPLLLLTGAATVSAQSTHPSTSQITRMLQASTLPADAGKGYKYVGPGSCSASACHGGIQARDTTKVLQNEYSTWIVRDRHSRAYTVLNQPLAQRMAKILKIGDPTKAQKCLVCHALSVPADQRGTQFDIAEGVSCESCHGPAEKWLGPHVEANAKHADMVRLGLVDNKDLAVRSERCLTCHLGAPGLEVDHEMLAAGHPDLTFELDSFSSIEPPHWVEKAPDGKEPINDKLFGVRIWSIGQATQLEESMTRLARHARGANWPEYTEMDCFTCHHSLTKPEDSWRQQEGYGTRRPGNPPYNPSRYVVFRHLARSADPTAEAELASTMTEISALVAELQPDRTVLAAKCDRGAQLAGELARKMRDMTYDRAQTERLMREIAEDSEGISFEGERSAEQAAMALDSLYLAYANLSGPNAELKSDIDQMYRLLDNPSAYNAPKFAAQMKKTSAAIR